MRPNRATVPLLRTVIGILLLLALLAQVLIPVLARDIVSQYVGFAEYPTLLPMIIPYSTLAISAIFCGQLALIFVMRLLSMVNAGEIFRKPALRWVTGIIVCCATATLLAIVTWVLQIITQVGYGGTFLLAAAAGLVGLAATLLMVVMRTLLVIAINQHGELEEVI